MRRSRQHAPGLRQSTVGDEETGRDSVLDGVRTSDGMFFQRGETELVRWIEARIASPGEVARGAW